MYIYIITYSTYYFCKNENILNYLNFPLYKFVELEYTYILYKYKYNNIYIELRFQMATEEELQILSIGFNSLSILT